MVNEDLVCAADYANDDCADPTRLLRADPCIMGLEGKCVVQFAVPVNEKTGVDEACLNMGGMVAEACPTTNVLGCCKVPTVAETCFYTNASSPMTADGCMQAGGMWLSMPD
jgi:hypothetical protein